MYIIREIGTVDSIAIVTNLRTILTVIALIVYVFSPVDFFPEAIFGIFGILDDIILLLFVILQIRLNLFDFY